MCRDKNPVTHTQKARLVLFGIEPDPSIFGVSKDFCTKRASKLPEEHLISFVFFHLLLRMSLPTSKSPDFFFELTIPLWEDLKVL